MSTCDLFDKQFALRTGWVCNEGVQQPTERALTSLSHTGAGSVSFVEACPTL